MGAVHPPVGRLIPGAQRDLHHVLSHSPISVRTLSMGTYSRLFTVFFVVQPNWQKNAIQTTCLVRSQIAPQRPPKPAGRNRPNRQGYIITSYRPIGADQCCRGRRSQAYNS